MTYKYYIFGVGDKNDAIDFDNGGIDRSKCIAERAAHHHWMESDPDESWPIELILVDEEMQESIFQIEMECIITFSATDFSCKDNNK